MGGIAATKGLRRFDLGVKMGAELSGGMITYMSPAARAPLLASVIHVTLSCNLRFNVQCSVATGNMSERGAGRCIGDMSVVGRSVGLPRRSVGLWRRVPRL